MLVYNDGPAGLPTFRLPSSIKLSLTHTDVAAQVRVDVTTFCKIRQAAWILHDPFRVSTVFASIS